MQHGLLKSLLDYASGENRQWISGFLDYRLEEEVSSDSKNPLRLYIRRSSVIEIKGCWVLWKECCYVMRWVRATHSVMTIISPFDMVNDMPHYLVLPYTKKHSWNGTNLQYELPSFEQTWRCSFLWLLKQKTWIVRLRSQKAKQGLLFEASLLQKGKRLLA